MDVSQERRPNLKMLQFLSLLLLAAPLEGANSTISCYNDQGEAVDWFYLYKLPKHSGTPAHSGTSSQQKGLAYLLLHTGNDGWTDGRTSINDSASAVGRTVGRLYSQETEVAYILYNDQPPKELSGRRTDVSGNTGGHTKGMVLLDKNQGFWLVHSTPHFPAARQTGRYFYPESGVNNGQNFICVTYPVEQFQTIGEQLQINRPHVYDCNVPESLANKVPALRALCGKNLQIAPHVKPVTNRSVTLTSKGGAYFTSFAKGGSFRNDLYHSWVSPALRSDLLVQFWCRSTGILPSNCSQGWKVLNIAVIQPDPAFRFKNTQDHSKWAVSIASGSANDGGWVCVGDINRNKAEEERGGGTVCLRDPVVWKAYRAAAVSCEDCDGKTVSCPM